MGILYLGENLSLESRWGGLSGTSDRTFLPVSLRLFISKVISLRVGMLHYIIVLGVGVAAEWGVHSEEVYLVFLTHDWLWWRMEEC